MKKVGGGLVILMVMCGFLLIGSQRAEAMSSESAALLAGAVVLLAPPVIQVVTGGFAYPAPAPRVAYYPARTEVVIMGGLRGYERERVYWRGPYGRRGHDYREEQRDAGRPCSHDRY